MIKKSIVATEDAIENKKNEDLIAETSSIAVTENPDEATTTLIIEALPEVPDNILARKTTTKTKKNMSEKEKTKDKAKKQKAKEKIKKAKLKEKAKAQATAKKKKEKAKDKAKKKKAKLKSKKKAAKKKKKQSCFHCFSRKLIALQLLKYKNPLRYKEGF